MISAMCFVQESQISKEQESSIRKEMENFSLNSFGETIELNWVVVPKNSGFTAGEPSSSVIVSVRSNEILEKQRRTILLKELCEILIAETGLSSNEVVGTITDPPN